MVPAMLHCTLYYTSHYISLHCIALHYITLYYIVLHYITLYHITSHHITSHHITSHHITSHHITSYPVTSHCITMHRIALLLRAEVCGSSPSSSFIHLHPILNIPRHLSTFPGRNGCAARRVYSMRLAPGANQDWAPLVSHRHVPTDHRSIFV